MGSYLWQRAGEECTLQDYVVYYSLNYIDCPHSSTMYYILQIGRIIEANSTT